MQSTGRAAMQEQTLEGRESYHVLTALTETVRRRRGQSWDLAVIFGREEDEDSRRFLQILLYICRREEFVNLLGFIRIWRFWPKCCFFLFFWVTFPLDISGISMNKSIQTRDRECSPTARRFHRRIHIGIRAERPGHPVPPTKNGEIQH